jgi:hypothetical protein
MIIQFEKNRHALLLKHLESIHEQMERAASSRGDTEKIETLETKWTDHRSRLKATAHAMFLQAARNLIGDALSQDGVGWKGVLGGIKFDTLLRYYKNAR